VSARAPKAQVLDDRFADNLHALRVARRVSRRELSARTGIPHHSIEKIETGCRPGPRRRASIGEAVVLAAALGVRPGELLKGGEPR
jgi:hypothetical protein